LKDSVLTGTNKGEQFSAELSFTILLGSAKSAKLLAQKTKTASH